MRQTLKGEGEERKDEEKFGVHGDRGWFTAVSGFLASYLQDHPSRASLPSKTKRDDFISDLPEAEHRGNQVPLAVCAPSARLTLATDLLSLFFFSVQHHHRAKFSRKNPGREFFQSSRKREGKVERLKNCPCEKIPDKNFLFATQKILCRILFSMGIRTRDRRFRKQ